MWWCATRLVLSAVSQDHSAFIVKGFGVQALVSWRQRHYQGADKSLARPTSRCIWLVGEDISFDASLVVYINSTNIPPIMIINRIYETQNLLSLQLFSSLVGLRTCQHPCIRVYRSADKSLARPTSRCILFDGENISFDASPVIYINSTNIPQIMIINRIYEHQNLLSL